MRKVILKTIIILLILYVLFVTVDCIRLRYAKQLLMEGALSVAEISERCGYSNPYYFTNVFKENFGQSPTAFRNAEKEKQVQQKIILFTAENCIEKARILCYYKLSNPFGGML